MEQAPKNSRGMWVDNTNIHLGRLDARMLSLTLPDGALRQALAVAFVSNSNTSVSIPQKHAGELKDHYTEAAASLLARGVEPALHLGYVATLDELIRPTQETHG